MKPGGEAEKPKVNDRSPNDNSAIRRRQRLPEKFAGRAMRVVASVQVLASPCDISSPIVNPLHGPTRNTCSQAVDGKS
jgi:hypothetical protein